MFSRAFMALLFAVCASCSVVFAQPPAAKDWTLTVGAAPVYSPVFQGADDYGLSVFPDLRVNYKDVFFASVPDGIGYNVINSNRWQVGPLVKIRFGRDDDTGGSPFLISGESTALQGLGTVRAAAELGGFVQYQQGPWRTRIELRQGTGGHDGLVGDVALNFVERVGPLSFSIGPRLSVGSSDFMQTYFGIDSTQARRTALAAYTAGGGLTSYGLGGSATLPISDAMALTLFASVERLGSEASDSPLIRVRGNANQHSIGIGFGYRFGWNE